MSGSWVMDYRSKVAEMLEKNRSEAGSLERRLSGLQQEFESYLAQSLEKMAGDLAKRNSYREGLSAREAEIVSYVESGRFDQVLKNLPESEQERHKRTVNKVYKIAKKKIPSGELVLAGYLDVEELNGDALVSLVIPVRYVDREKRDSLEEALYEHNVNVGDFQDDKEDNHGYVRLELKVEKDKAGEAVQRLVTKLGKDLPQELASHNIKYGVVLLSGLPPARPVEEVGEGIEYTLPKAARVWSEKLAASGKRVPKGLLYYMLINRIRKGNGIKARREGEAYIIDKKELDSFIDTHDVERTTGKLYRVVPRVEGPEKYVSLVEAVNSWNERLQRLGVHIPKENIYASVRGRATRGEFSARTFANKYFLDRQEFEEFAETHYLRKSRGKKYIVASMPQRAEEIARPGEIKVSEVSRALDMSWSGVRDLVNRKALERTRTGYISGKSLTEFLRTHTKKGGVNRVRWVKKG